MDLNNYHNIYPNPQFNTFGLLQLRKTHTYEEFRDHPFFGKHYQHLSKPLILLAKTSNCTSISGITSGLILTEYWDTVDITWEAAIELYGPKCTVLGILDGVTLRNAMT